MKTKPAMTHVRRIIMRKALETYAATLEVRSNEALAREVQTLCRILTQSQPEREQSATLRSKLTEHTRTGKGRPIETAELGKYYV